jgi:L-asparaginase
MRQRLRITCASFLADLLIEGPKPVVFTGAQLAHDHPQSNGPRNLLDSIRAAAANAVRGLGVLACFNGELHAARDVTKVHTSAIETFQSYGHGAVGVVDGEQVVIYRRPQLRVHLTPLDLNKRVSLIKAVMGIDERCLDPILATGIDGLVVAAFGRGNLGAELAKRLVRVCGDGVPVVVTSRCPSGRVMPIYGGGGGDLEDAGVIFSGDLKGPKARLLLMAALADPEARPKLRDLFRAIAP